MNAGQHIGAIICCNNVEKLLSCFKCCFYPQDLFVLLSKNACFISWAIVLIFADVKSEEDLPSLKVRSWNTAVKRCFFLIWHWSNLENIGEPTFPPHPTFFFLLCVGFFFLLQCWLCGYVWWMTEIDLMVPKNQTLTDFVTVVISTQLLM